MVLTCVTIDTTEQQNPATNAVTNKVITDSAKIVTIQANEYGSAINRKIFRRPNCITAPPKIPPKNAPKISKFKSIIYKIY